MVSRALILPAILTLTLAACGGRQDPSPAVRTAFSEYDAAFRKGDMERVKAHLAAEKAKELAGEEAAALFTLASKMRPADAKVLACEVADGKATLKLHGRMEGAKGSGTVTMVLENGAWRVAKEDWSFTMEAAPEPPPVESMPEAVRKLVDQVASMDALEGSKAWLAIGARYQSASAFLAEVKPALWDDRPVAFAMVEETFDRFRYFTVKSESSKGAEVPAGTVGKALRYHLWQYEDVSDTGFAGSFAEWWAGYAPSKELPQ